VISILQKSLSILTVCFFYCSNSDYSASLGYRWIGRLLQQQLTLVIFWN